MKRHHFNPLPMPSMKYLHLLTAVLCVIAASASAHEGGEHGNAEPDATTSTAPRFVAVSAQFELVGVLDGRQLTLYLDHAANNAPVEGATLELDIGGVKVPVQAHGSGEFEATLAKAPGDGVTAVTATVIAAGESDLLAGELDIHAAANAHDAGGGGWQRYLPWGVAALFALLAALLGARRRRPVTEARA